MLRWNLYHSDERNAVLVVVDMQLLDDDLTQGTRDTLPLLLPSAPTHQDSHTGDHCLMIWCPRWGSDWAHTWSRVDDVSHCCALHCCLLRMVMVMMVLLSYLLLLLLNCCLLTRCCLLHLLQPLLIVGRTLPAALLSWGTPDLLLCILTQRRADQTLQCWSSCWHWRPPRWWSRVSSPQLYQCLLQLWSPELDQVTQNDII